MNKRGQMYILAAIVLSIAIFGVMKVTNKFISPIDDNFDFYVENFEGERSYVVNLGLLEGESGDKYLKESDSYQASGLLNLFQEFGINTGVVLIERQDSNWIVTNYLGDNLIAQDSEGEGFVLESSQETIAEVSFSFIEGGSKFKLGETDMGQWEKGKDKKTRKDTYYSKSFENTNTLNLIINKNIYPFSSADSEREILLFKNIDENYIKVVKI